MSSASAVGASPVAQKFFRSNPWYGFQATSLGRCTSTNRERVQLQATACGPHHKQYEIDGTQAKSTNQSSKRAGRRAPHTRESRNRERERGGEKGRVEQARTAVPNQQQLDEVVVVAPRPRRRRRHGDPRRRRLPWSWISLFSLSLSSRGGRGGGCEEQQAKRASNRSRGGVSSCGRRGKQGDGGAELDVFCILYYVGWRRPVQVLYVYKKSLKASLMEGILKKK
jgi:hypothetical protein